MEPHPSTPKTEGGHVVWCEGADSTSRGSWFTPWSRVCTIYSHASALSHVGVRSFDPGWVCVCVCAIVNYTGVYEDGCVERSLEGVSYAVKS